MVFLEENILQQHQYSIEITMDQSPTLRLDLKESMHHMGGAAGESVYLYYEALARFYCLCPTRMNMDFTVLSFGFGLGYNEILTVLFFLINNLNLSSLKLDSREKDVFLYALFNTWLEAEGPTESIFNEVYAGIARSLKIDLASIPMSKIKTALCELRNSGRWLQRGAITEVENFEGRYDVVLYDAFSAKMDGLLWSEEFLFDFFKTQLSKHFVFSTYACTAVLKRAALNSQSYFDKRAGFMGKRNSSLIYR